MKQIVIISGKGGTGKTVIAGAFAALAKNKVMVDCDVDAANLHLLLHPDIKEKFLFKGLPRAFINQDKCTGCGECMRVCRYNAVIQSEDGKLHIDEIYCEGCMVCLHICPSKAIDMVDNIAGEWYISKTKYGVMVHGKLGIAEENSGKLVAKIRQVAKEIAEKSHCEYIIIDGPPGIGCPVISSITGTDAVLIVTEPTLSGMHDMKRVIELTCHFKTKTFVVINKYDINPEMTEKIEKYCQKSKIELVGKIAYDSIVIEAMVNRKTVVEYSDREVAKQIKNVWEVISDEVR